VTYRGLVSIGFAASLGPEVIARLAPAAEDAGFHGLWVNDTPGADSLAALSSAALVTTQLTLATGVVPVDRQPAAEIAASVGTLDLPQERLVLGIGSGAAKNGALAMVRDAAAALRGQVSARVIVGALGPRMRRLAVEHSDGVLLTWLTPSAAREQAVEARAAASGAHVVLYVRTALDPGAGHRLDVESARYAAIPSYAANFIRQGATASETVMDAGIGPIEARLDDYRAAVDEVVLRAITPTDSVEDCLSFIRAAGALL
jgi:alkanesulfonate monooxygenase SsuD/methylene tetrahydromethanopterin reductase-like flavin-dependent oxidoreductase (luciferase family)